MCYHVVTKRVIAISRSTVKGVTNLVETTYEVKDTFNNLDAVICAKIKHKERGYDDDKTNPEDWDDLIEEYEDFCE